MWQAHSSPDPIQCAAVLGPIKAEPFGWPRRRGQPGQALRAAAVRTAVGTGRMLAARVEPKNGPRENKKTGNFKSVVFDEYQTGVDTTHFRPPWQQPAAALPLGWLATRSKTSGRSEGRRLIATERLRIGVTGPGPATWDGRGVDLASSAAAGRGGGSETLSKRACSIGGRLVMTRVICPRPLESSSTLC
jgi:hypothetical protein